jgi:beta-1,4-mannosyltransferase
VAQIVRQVRGTRLIIDWHNFAYTILGLSVGSEHFTARLLRWFENRLGRSADMHLTVTKAMAGFLKEEWDVSGRVVTLYDKPDQSFHRLSSQEIHEFVGRVCNDIPSLQSTVFNSSSTLLTMKQRGKFVMKPDRPAVIVSGTSWTADEDMTDMLDALVLYDALAQADNSLPDLRVVITGIVFKL